ncbi:sulfatase/phosphatase domain-containing protein, partial [Caldivirga sp.]|uniref:sulfatase/phosphatase domain-containing protein n=1 Tax=Caldivirga sp. TaxID=2080243 RepID=UPI003D11C344
VGHGLDLPGAKATLHDPGIEVALMMSCPNCGIGGGRIDALTSHIDLLPTILDVIGLKAPSNVQGVSLMPLLKGNAVSVRDFVIAEKTYHEKYDPVRAIRTSRFKLIMHFEAMDIEDEAIDSKLSPAHSAIADELAVPNEYVELYDLEKDPLELHDVSREPEYENALKELLNKLYNVLKGTNDPILNGPIPSPHYYQALRILKGEEPTPPRTRGIPY